MPSSTSTSAARFMRRWRLRSPRMRRRIRPVPTPSSSHERRTGARRHAAGSWNGRCGAPRTNAHSPPLCAAAPLRGITRASSGAIANVPARTPRASGWPLRLTRVVWQGGSVRHLYPRRTWRAPRRCERQRPGGGYFCLRVRPQGSYVVSRGLLDCAAPACHPSLSIANPPSRWSSRWSGPAKPPLWCMAHWSALACRANVLGAVLDLRELAPLFVVVLMMAGESEVPTLLAHLR